MNNFLVLYLTTLLILSLLFIMCLFQVLATLAAVDAYYGYGGYINLSKSSMLFIVLRKEFISVTDYSIFCYTCIFHSFEKFLVFNN